MKINIMTILYYVVIVTQLSMVSFNNYNYCKNANVVVDTIKDDTTETVSNDTTDTVSNDTTDTVSNDTVNIINDNLKHITHDQINNNASNQSFITDFSFWDFSQPSGFMIGFLPTISFKKVDLFLPLGNISPHIKLFNDKIGIKIKRSNFSKPYTFTIQYAQLLQLIRSLFFRKQQIHNNNFNQNQVNNNKVTFNQCFILNRSKGHEKIDIAHFKGLLYEIYYMALTNFNVNFYALDNINILKINYTYSTYINSNDTRIGIGIEERSFRLLSMSSLLKLLGYNIIPKWLKILQLNLNHNTCTSSENQYTNLWTYDFYIAKVKIQRNLILFNTLKMHIFFSRSLTQCKMNEGFFNNINGKAPKTNFGVQIKINNDGIYEITITSFFKQKATININFMNFIIISHTFNDTQLFLTIKLSAFNITLPLPINNTSQSTNKNYNTNKQENNQVSNLDSVLYNDNNTQSLINHIPGILSNLPGILDNIMNIMNTNIK